MRPWTLLATAVLLLPPAARAQFPGDSVLHPTLAPHGGGQFADTAFHPTLPRPAFAPGRGPLVLIDAAHANFHTVDGRYAAFAALLRADGFTVEGLSENVSTASLGRARVLVIANAIGARNAAGNWTLPTPSAFSAAEIEALHEWVAAGGSLLLIADHMPFPGATAPVAAAFGVIFTNGFATDAAAGADEFVFSRANGGLGEHAITRGIDSVRSFTGQAFRAVVPVAPLLTLAPGSVILLPARAWEFSERTPWIRGDGMFQGLVLEAGKGRVAIFGEAAMFSAQIAGADHRPMGMNAPDASQNPQFLLNVVHWLAGLLR